MPVVAVVSGVNSGNDFHIVLRLARELPQDGIVYLCSRDECRRQQAANEIPLELGSKVKVLQMDVTDPKSVIAAVDELSDIRPDRVCCAVLGRAQEHPDGIDVLVNNAGSNPKVNNPEWMDHQAKRRWP